MADVEKNKGFSLRKNKASRKKGNNVTKEISSPLGGKSQIAAQAYLPGVTSNIKTQAPQRQNLGGTTSDIVKKRYSVRYNQAPDFNTNDAPPVPSLPSIPQKHAKQASVGESGPIQEQRVELRALKDPSLQAETYVQNVLSGSSEQDIQDYQNSLKKVKNRASTDLQHNVYQNRTQFIKISKEAENLKDEMQMLRSLMSDLTTTLGQSSLGASYTSGQRSPTLDDGATAARKRNNRSSVANLEAMRNTQLQALWKSIEGSQKFLPAIPGRHIVQESGYWVELDAATWKPRRPVHIVLLNDHLLIATKRRKRVDPSTAINGNSPQKAPTKLVAERCWSLQEIDMLDLASGAKTAGPSRDIQEIKNAISIRHGRESFTYRSDHKSSSEKLNLLLSFKRTLEELRKAERADVDENNKTKETIKYLSARDPAISSSPGLLRSLSKSKDRPELLIDVDGKQRNLRWVEGQIDELDIEIALQRFDEAVQHVEQLRRLAKGLKNNTIAQDLITVKVYERARKLADLITARLTDTHSFLTATRTNISHLHRLTYTSLARSTYLSARSASIRLRARQCVFEGDLVTHITHLSFIYFTLMKNTVAVYQQCFPQDMMSAVVVWAKERLDEFLKVLGRGLESVERGGLVWGRAIAVAREHAGMMGEVGLEFRGLVGAGWGVEGGDLDDEEIEVGVGLGDDDGEGGTNDNGNGDSSKEFA